MFFTYLVVSSIAVQAPRIRCYDLVCKFQFSGLLMLSMGDGGGGHCLVWMEWRPARWSVCLPLLIFPCTIKSRLQKFSSGTGSPGWPGKRAIKRLWWWLCYQLFSLKLELPSVLWHCWLIGRKGIRPVKWWGIDVVICLERGANDLHMVQLMPLPPRRLLLQ